MASNLRSIAQDISFLILLLSYNIIYSERSNADLNICEHAKANVSLALPNSQLTGNVLRTLANVLPRFS